MEPEEEDKLSGLFFGNAGSLTKRRTTISGLFGALSRSSAIGKLLTSTSLSGACSQLRDKKAPS